MVKIDQELLDQLAEMEAEALHEGMQDAELRRTPSFLGAVRRFLQQNNLKTTSETPGVEGLQKLTADIPDFSKEFQ